MRPRRSSFTLAWRLRRRRKLLLLLPGIYLLYIFFKYMPSDLRPAIERYDPRFPKPGLPRPPTQRNPTSPGDEEQDYDGQLKFPWLARSLYDARAITQDVDNAVLFAAADLHSVSDLIPLACEMAQQRVNTVHFALLSREQVSIEGIKHVNGISNGDCPVFWHDARLDHSASSTEARMKTGVTIAVDYINTFLKTKVIIAHSNIIEEDYFWNGVKEAADWRHTPLIKVSTKALDLIWLSRLDSHSLQAWNDVHVNMLVQASPGSFGSLRRLLRSLGKADYLDTRPLLTIDLPSQFEPLLLDSINRIVSAKDFPVDVTLRRRVDYGMTPIQSTIRTVEAFYPRDPKSSHLLFLSPQAELSPSFYHYLKYTTLRYRHSVHAENKSSHLLGISLELPARMPTDDSSFSAPTTVEVPFFRWQAPNSNAALYFGDKWAEFHMFLTNRLAASVSRTGEPEKLISIKYPSFIEHLLELMRVKGYHLLYPSFPATQAFSLATIHNELYQPPEEFLAGSTSTSQQWDDYSQELQTKPREDVVIELGSIERPLTRDSTINRLLQRLPLQIPELESLPLLSFTGDQVSGQSLSVGTKLFAKEFSTSIGGCDEVPAKLEHDEDSYTINDLFCIG